MKNTHSSSLDVQTSGIYSIDIDAIRIGNYIVGSADFDAKANWIARLINGSQVPDVDRLDYVARDSYLS